MHANYRLDYIHSITNERIAQARREHMVHQHDRNGESPVVRFRQLVKGVSVSLRQIGSQRTPAGVPSR
jgi:hypothetical protein